MLYIVTVSIGLLAIGDVSLMFILNLPTQLITKHLSVCR